MTEINLERTANEPISEGIHTLKIVAGEEGEGQAGPYWNFTVTCTDEGEADKTTRMFVSLSPQARWRLEIFLDAIGAPRKGKATIEKFIGRMFKGKITHELYEGRTQAKVGDMFSLAHGAPKATAAPVVVSASSVDPASDVLPDDVVEDFEDFDAQEE